MHTHTYTHRPTLTLPLHLSQARSLTPARAAYASVGPSSDGGPAVDCLEPSKACAVPAGADDGASAKKLTKVEFPLFLEHPADRTKYTYGVFLLNKNLEQLLNAHGLRSAGPRHTLQNLRRILNARCVVASAREEEDAHP